MCVVEREGFLSVCVFYSPQCVCFSLTQSYLTYKFWNTLRHFYGSLPPFFLLYFDPSHTKLCSQKYKHIFRWNFIQKFFLCLSLSKVLSLSLFHIWYFFFAYLLKPKMKIHKLSFLHSFHRESCIFSPYLSFFTLCLCWSCTKIMWNRKVCMVYSRPGLK